jgi:hypothetical protein
LLLLAACSPEVETPESTTSPPAQEEPALADLLDGRPLPPHARPEMVAEFRSAEALEFSASDGQGSASVAPGDPVPASSHGAWTITYRAGPLGIASGGALVVQVSPFWGWTSPQPFDERYPGFTRVETDAVDTRLVAEPCGQNCLRIGVEDAALEEGEEVRIRYGGAGPAQARVDRFAEEAEEFFLRVDGDGDGVTAPLDAHPALDILPGPARSLHVVVPSRARVGGEVWLQLAALDATWNAAIDFVGEVEVVEATGLEGLPERIEIRPEDGGARRIAARAAKPGISRVVVPPTRSRSAATRRQSCGPICTATPGSRTEARPPSSTSPTPATSRRSTWCRSPTTTTSGCASSTARPRCGNASGEPSRALTNPGASWRSSASSGPTGSSATVTCCTSMMRER